MKWHFILYALILIEACGPNRERSMDHNGDWQNAKSRGDFSNSVIFNIKIEGYSISRNGDALSKSEFRSLIRSLKGISPKPTFILKFSEDDIESKREFYRISSMIRREIGCEEHNCYYEN